MNIQVPAPYTDQVQALATPLLFDPILFAAAPNNNRLYKIQCKITKTDTTHPLLTTCAEH